MHPFVYKHERSGRVFTVSGENTVKALKSPRFDRWIRGLPKHLDLWSVNLRVDLMGIGTTNERVLFVNVRATCMDRNIGERAYLTSMLTGDSVGCLIILNCEHEYYVLLVEQNRPSVGERTREIVAGRMDGATDPLAKIVEEIREETGLELPRNTIRSLTARPLYTSPGQSDERMHLYACEVKVTREKLESLQGQLHGNPDENEKTRLVILPVNEVHHNSDDMKTGLALQLWLTS